MSGTRLIAGWIRKLKHLSMRTLEHTPWLNGAVRELYGSETAQRIRFTFWKGSLRRILHWLLNGHVVRCFRIKRYLNAEEINLQVGGGYHTIDGWLNGDLIAGDIYLDATKELPFPDNCLDHIFTEQFFEHLSYEAGIGFLRESYRILKPGGIVRQSTPSLEGLIDVYLDRNRLVSRKDVLQRHISVHRPTETAFSACQFMNDMFRLWGHQFIYDRETLGKVYQDIGFVKIEWKFFGDSNHDALRNRERHADVSWMKSAFVIICEAQKPQTDWRP